MIDKVCYTYWTNEGSKYNCGFQRFEVFENFFRISVDESLKYFSEVVIHTDQEGYDKISSTISGDNISYEIIDYSVYTFDERFWNFPKFITYNMQSDPFIHIDCDAVFIEDPNDKDAQVLTEKTRGTVILKRDVYPLLSPDIKKHVEIICSGLLGGNNTQVFKDLHEVAMDTLIEREFENVTFNSLVAVEEIAFTHLVHDQEIPFKELGVDCFIHFQGSLKSNLTTEDVINVDTIKNKYLLLNERGLR